MTFSQLDNISTVIDMINSRPPACGLTKLITIDGPSGAGKSTLASELASELPAHTVSMEGIYRGWGGLESGIDVLTKQVLEPIASGDPGCYREWDWACQQPATRVYIPVVPLLVVEGVGSGARGPRSFASMSLWVDADAHIRRRRALRREGDGIEAWWKMWAAQEKSHFSVHATRLAADICICTDS